MKNINNFKLLSDYEAEKSAGTLNSPNVIFIAEHNSIKYYEDPYNGYEYVDLGLPSGLKWATCNIGADSPEKTGLYFAWGETVGYTDAQVKAGERKFDEDTYNAGAAASISDNLTLEQDAAHINMGGNWRMPTKAEFKELINSSYTTKTLTTNYNKTKVPGYIITSKTNGNSIFLPAAGSIVGSSGASLRSLGSYWSSTFNLSSCSWYLSFDYDNTPYMKNNSINIYGFSVRGVCE